MKQSLKDECVLYNHYPNDKDFDIGCNWVDDLICACTSKENREKIRMGLCKTLKIGKYVYLDDMGQTVEILGGNLTKVPLGLHLSCTRGVSKLITGFNLEDHIQNTVKKTTPFTPGKTLSKADDGVRIDTERYPYRSGVGSISHLANYCWPILSFARSQFARVQEDPKEQHWKELKRTIIFIGQNPDLGIMFYRDNPRKYDVQLNLSAGRVDGISVTPDASFADDKESRRSTVGYHVCYNGSLVSWRSKLEREVATSTVVAELMALDKGARQSLSLYHLLLEILPSRYAPKPIQVYGDNTNTIEGIKTAKNAEGKKHLAIKWMFTRQKYKEGLLQRPVWISTEENDADLQTKGVNAQQFARLLPKCMVSLRDVLPATPVADEVGEHVPTVSLEEKFDAVENFQQPLTSRPRRVRTVPRWSRLDAYNQLGFRGPVLEIKDFVKRGRGLVAKVAIPRDTYITTYHGVIMTAPKIGEDLPPDHYGVPVNGIASLLVATKESNDELDEIRDWQRLASLANHSSNPNCQLRELVETIMNTVFLVSIKDIFPGQELLVDYGEDYWTGPDIVSTQTDDHVIIDLTKE